MAVAPGKLSKFRRVIVACLLIAVCVIAFILSTQQKKFSTANFEFGQLTAITGTYQSFPVPSIRTTSYADMFGTKTSLTIPLVGYGKTGAASTIATLEQQNNISFDNKTITLTGTLLYSDGKALLQVDEHDHPLVSISKNAPVPDRHEIKELGVVQLTGEILDPKCYFGVMKPGQGKPHKDCAIRCIEGGINPVFMTRNKQGEASYFLLCTSGNKPVSSLIKNHIAEPVTLTARRQQYDDWTILYIDQADNIKPIGGWSWFKGDDIECK